MIWSVDTRIPLMMQPRMSPPCPKADRPFAALVGENAIAPAGAVLTEQFAEVGHVTGCGCCRGRSAAAIALDRMFLARARAVVPWFDEVVASVRDAQAEACLRADLAADAVSTARFRLC